MEEDLHTPHQKGGEEGRESGKVRAEGHTES